MVCCREIQLINQNVFKKYIFFNPVNAFTDDPGKYLVVDPSWMSDNGTECNKIGVQPRAFSEQPERCYQSPGSCLNRQPIELMQKASRKDRGTGDVRLTIQEYLKGENIRYDDDAEQIIVDRRRNDTNLLGNPAISVRGVSHIKLNDNALINDKFVNSKKKY